VWTPQLHKSFEEAVDKLGIDKAVPKNIMKVGEGWDMYWECCLDDKK
jgi:SHAQKYF class myb-like DNA-binding protein